MIPDYYERLGVDAAAPSTAIEAALRKKQPAWSMGTRNPKTRHANQRFLDEIPALRAALLNGPDARAAYDAERTAADVARREEALDELHRLVRLRAAKGGLAPADVELLGREADRLGVDAEALARLAESYPALTADDAAAVDPDDDDGPPPDAPDRSTRRQIRMALDHLDRRDLYDALGLFRDAPLALIADRADEERRRWMKKTQVTAEKTAWLEVVTLAQTHLGDAKSRARYDRGLVAEAEDRFVETAAFALKGLVRIDSGTHVALIDEAGAMGIPPDRAHRLIRRAGRKAGVATDATAAPTSAAAARPAGTKILRCRNCAGVTELPPTARSAATARCRHCGASLRWECPVCKRSNLVDARKCSCGFRLSLREALLARFAAAQHAFRTHDLATAKRQLAEVQRYAPEHVGARNGMARIAEREREIDELRARFEQAEAGSRLVEAARALGEWRKLAPAGAVEIAAARDRIAERLRKAEALAARARVLERTDPPEARLLYARALHLAADLAAAVEGRRRCPPDAPTNLDAHAAADGVRLSWRPPEPDGLDPPAFVVLRKPGELPEHPADGVPIGETRTAEFLDATVEPGATVSYAVVCRRGEARSVTAVAAGPITFLPDVRDLRAAAREGEILLTWIAPPGAVEIRVTRNATVVPRNPRHGERIAAAHDSAADRDVEEGRVYHYGVFAVYRSPEGRRFPSPGATISATAGALAVPVGPPLLALDPTGRVRIEWIEPARGAVRIRSAATPQTHPPGAIVAAADVEAVEGAWIEPSRPGGADDFAPGDGPGRYYTPMTDVDGRLIVGRGAWLTRLADPTDLRAVRLDPLAATPDVARIQLRWTWPADARSTRVAARRGRAPDGPDDPDALRFDVDRAGYDRLGGWTLLAPTPPAAENGDGANHWHVRVFAREEADGAPRFSPGAEPTAATVAPGPNPEITVSYRWIKPWFPGRPWTLALRTDPPGAETPPLVVVANPRAVPIAADDGEIVARFPAARDAVAMTLPADPRLAEDRLRAFVDPSHNPDSLPPVRIRHPETGRPRV